MRLMGSWTLSLLLVFSLCFYIGCGGEESSSDADGGGMSSTTTEASDDTTADEPAEEESTEEEVAEAEVETPAPTETEAETSEEATSEVTETETESAPVETATPEGYGRIVMTFVYDGDAPKPDTIVPEGTDADYCKDDGLTYETLVVNPDNKGIANVVAWMTVGRGEEAPEAHASTVEAMKKPVTLDNIGCRFEPHVVVVQTGQTLLVKNSDEIGHNTKGNLVKNSSFNDNLPAGSSLEKVFDSAETLPMNVECTAHPWMQAKLMVVEHPFFGVSDKMGQLVIENVPVGKYTFRFQHETSGYLRDAEIGGEKVSRRGEVEIEVKEGENDLGTVKLDPKAFEK